MAKSMILVASLCCCILFSAAPVAADRDVPEATNYLDFLRLRKLRKKNKFKQQQTEGVVDQAGNVRIRTKSESRDSVLGRAFVLAVVFWAVKLGYPPLVRYARRLIKDFAKFKELARRRRKGRSRRAPYARDAQSISPSVMEIMDLGDDDDDDDASFISASTSLASVFSSVGSFARSRRRMFYRSSAHLTPKQHATKSSSKQKPSNSSRRTYDDAENGTKGDLQQKLPRVLHFIDEDRAAEATTPQHSNHRKGKGTGNNNEWLDDVSHIPTTGRIQHAGRGHNPKRNTQSDSSPLERKLSAGSGHELELVVDQKHRRQEKHKPSSQHHHHHQGRHRHRDRKK